jgi:ornithine cyclodeaminase/alanine dehydrogenase-like protein (mu-crystallin family)
MTVPPLVYLSAAEVRRALPMPDAIAAMREALVQLSSGQVLIPPRVRIDAPSDHGVALVMSCHGVQQRLFGLKLITLLDRNRQEGLPLVQALVIVADGTTGTPLAIMDGASLTALRTGAASGAATDCLARRDAEAAAEQFAAEMTQRLGLQVQRAASPGVALEEAAVVCTATTSGKPVFEDRELAPGAHINAVGSYRPDCRDDGAG